MRYPAREHSAPNALSLRPRKGRPPCGGSRGAGRLSSHLFNPLHPGAVMAAKPKKELSEEMLKFLVANSLKKDKFEVHTASVGEDGTSIEFTARSESGMISVSGSFADPQEDLELEEQPGPDEEPEKEH